MTRRNQLKIIFYLNLATVILLVAYKLYLNLSEREFHSAHATQVERIHESLAGKSQFRFAVIGNSNNSIGIFERKIIPALNDSDVDFVISAGNAVRNGGEDKYRALEGTLNHLRKPWLLTFGPDEASNFGGFRFYDRFGPYFYAFTTGNSRFLFLDSTGQTSTAWQLQWLKRELETADEPNLFIFLAHPVFPAEHETLLDSEDDYLRDANFRDGIIALAERYKVTAVFSSNLPIYEQQRHGITDYIITGGAGGFVLHEGNSHHHLVMVDVRDDAVAIRPAIMDIGQYRIFRKLESLWFFFHALMYTGYTNFLLIVSLFTILAIKLHTMIFTERDYYPRFDVDPAPWFEQAHRVAMFTNNYLPFIGGVPIAIERLRRGLQHMGREVLVFAPDYKRDTGDEGTTYRLPSLLVFGANKEFRLANIFLWRVRRKLAQFKPDIIHLHHPVWVGSLGLFWARRMGIPAVFTYHTRFEHYAHFVNLPDPVFRNLIAHTLVRRFANKCDGVIVPTYSAEEYLRLIGVKSKIFVQPTGIEYERFRKPDPARVAELRRRFKLDGKRVLVSVSRLSKEKNIDFMLDCVTRLSHRMDEPFRFVIVGEGPERDRLQQRIHTAGLDEIVILAGRAELDDMPAWYAVGDIFLFASKTETQGMVILEAMAASLPVVAVRSSGIDDVVQDGVNGFKTPEDPGKWCARVHELLHDEALRERLAENAARFAKDHSIENFAHNIAGIYAYILAGREKQHNKERNAPATPARHCEK